MPHGIINEQGNCLDVRYAILGKTTIFHMLPYKYLVSGALILGIIVNVDNNLQML